MSRQGALGDQQRVCGPGEAAVLGDGFECPQSIERKPAPVDSYCAHHASAGVHQRERWVAQAPMPFPDAPIRVSARTLPDRKFARASLISCFTTTNDKCTFLKNSINVLPKERPEIQSLRPLFMGVTILKKYTPVLYAVMAILMSARGGAVHAADAEEPAVSDESIGEVIVTATRRSENIQNVPIAIRH